jgi:hypothetical protein
LSTDGHTDADAYARALFLARLVRAAGPIIDDLPSGALKREFVTLIRKHGDELGISLSTVLEPRGTLLDAKIEIDTRIDELGIPHYAEKLTAKQYRALTDGTSITQEQLEVVAPHSVGRHLRAAEGLPLERVAAGQWACGVIVGALAEAWRY